MARQKVPPKQQHRARGVSLPPDVEKSAMNRAIKLDISFSKYVSRLIRADLERGVLAKEQETTA